MERSRRRRMEWQVWLPYASILLVGLLLLVRAHYGMDTTDETYYLSSAKRFADGDFLIKDDWNLGSLMGLILLPLYKCYVFFRGDNEGIILFARLLFVLLEVFTASFLFQILYERTRNLAASLVPALCVLLYVRANILTFSYYSLCMHTYLLAILWWARAELCETSWPRVLSGISFSVSVLCMPYLALLFLVLLAAWSFRFVREREPDQRFLYFLAGILLAAVAFLLAVGRLIPWTEIFTYLPRAFEDPTIEKEGPLLQYADTIVYLVAVSMKYTWPLYLLTFAGTLVCMRNPRGGRLKKWLVLGLLGEFVVQAAYVRTFFEGGILLVFLLFAIQYQLLFTQARDGRLERFFLVPGACFCAVWVLGSNVGHRVANMGFLIMDIWAVPIVFDGLEERRWLDTMKKFPAYVLVVVLALIRFFDVYRDGGLADLTVRVESGVMRGIHTEWNRAQAYERAVGLLKRETKEGDMVLAVGCNPWIYLDTPGRCGSYSTWAVSGEDPLAEDYYRTFPKRRPDFFILPSPELDTYESWRFSSHGAGLHEGEELELQGIFETLAGEAGYERRQEDGITWYGGHPTD